MLCPCRSEKSFESCCGAILSGQSAAKSPEQLMRSRYSAYATHHAEYILQTYALNKRSEHSVEDISKWSKQCQWRGLIIHNHLKEKTTGQVEFSAFYIDEKTLWEMREKSNFIIEDDKWFYVDGDFVEHHDHSKTARNQSCPCNSGKKFKQCCGRYL